MKNKNLKAILFALSISVFGLSGCNESSMDIDDLGVPFEMMLNDLSDTTLLDEVIKNGGYSNLVSDFTVLEQYLITTSKLDNLDLDSKLDDSKVKCDTILTTTDINQMIANIESLDVNSEEYKKALEILKYNEGILNKWISENGYRIVSQMGSLVVKAKLAEACNLDESSYNSFSIFDNVGSVLRKTYVKHNTNGIETTYTISRNSEDGSDNFSIDSLIKDCYHNQSEERKSSTEYNSTLCNDLLKSISLIKRTMCSNYIKNENTIYARKNSEVVVEDMDKMLKKVKGN